MGLLLDCASQGLIAPLSASCLSPLPKDQVSKDKALQSMASMSSAQIVSASVLQNKLSPPPPLPQAVFSAAPRVRRWSCLAQKAPQSQVHELATHGTKVPVACVAESDLVGNGISEEGGL